MAISSPKVPICARSCGERASTKDSVEVRHADEPAEHAPAHVEHDHDRDRLRVVREERNLPRRAVVEDREVFLRKVGGEPAIGFVHRRIDRDGVDGRLRSVLPAVARPVAVRRSRRRRAAGHRPYFLSRAVSGAIGIAMMVRSLPECRWPSAASCRRLLPSRRAPLRTDRRRHRSAGPPDRGAATAGSRGAAERGERDGEVAAAVRIGRSGSRKRKDRACGDARSRSPRRAARRWRRQSCSEPSASLAVGAAPGAEPGLRART